MGHPLICGECGSKFEGRTIYIRCCSSTCRMRRWRRTDKGKAVVVRNNAKVKRPDIKKVCPNCGKLYITARIKQYLCSACSKSVGMYESQKRYRLKNVEKVRKWGNANKQAQRRFYYSECCIIKGCLNEGHRHHPDYNEPNEIVWLCRQHYKDAHTGKGRSVFTASEIRKENFNDKYYQAIIHLNSVI